MIFGYFVLVVAIAISAVAAYYSIVGLTAIFAAAVIPIVIMGIALEIGKVTAAVWLKLNWHRAALIYKIYLIPAVAILMLLTSMGIFGFLSKAHLDQAAPTTTVSSQVSFLDEKIATERENVNVARKALQQLDKTIDETIARSSTEEGVTRAANLRRTQQAERRRLQSDIENAQNNISKYTEERQPLAAQLRTIEAEVGPIKYIAALIYGDTVDYTLLESAVRIVILIIVAVFDPLALILIIAAQQSIRWARDEAQEQPIKDEVKVANEDLVVTQPTEEVPPASVDERIYDPQKFPYLDKTSHFVDLKPMPSSEKVDEPTMESVSMQPETVSEDLSLIVVAPSPSSELVINDEPIAPKIPETAKRYKAPMPIVPESLNVRKTKNLVENTVVTKTDFGTVFPSDANNGDTFLRVDLNPNKLFKFNGFKWIEVDKSRTDSYSYNERYIDFLIDKISKGEYEIDQLSSVEQELIAEKLARTNDNT